MDRDERRDARFKRVSIEMQQDLWSIGGPYAECMVCFHEGWFLLRLSGADTWDVRIMGATPHQARQSIKAIIKGYKRQQRMANRRPIPPGADRALGALAEMGASAGAAILGALVGRAGRSGT